MIKRNEHVAQILERALELLRLHGWCQFTGSTAMGTRCLIAASSHVMTHEEQVEFYYDGGYEALGVTPVKVLKDVITERHPEIYGAVDSRGGDVGTGWYVVYFNDHIARTLDDVEVVLKEAIERARNS